MKKYEIIKKNTDFNDIINTGTYIRSKYYYIYYKDNEFDFPKFGLAVSKKCGNSVMRNKIKRQLRSIIDNYKDLFQNGLSYIIIPKRNISEVSYQKMEKDLVSLLERKEN